MKYKLNLNNLNEYTLIVESAFAETKILSNSCIPEVSEVCPTKVCRQQPSNTSQTRIVVSKLPLITIFRA